jgi:hypothetical protein
MSGRYSTIVRTLSREAHEAAARAKAKLQAAIVEKDLKDLKDLERKYLQSSGHPDWRARHEEYWQRYSAYKSPRSAEYLNRQLDEILNDLANVLATSLSTNHVINLPFHKRAGPTRVLIDKVGEDNQQVDEFVKGLRGVSDRRGCGAQPTNRRVR